MRRFTPTTLVILTLACAGGQHATPADRGGTTFTLADFRKLAWLQGTWQGTENGENAFFEEYNFVNDSTITIVTYVDSKLDSVRAASSVYFTGGHIYHRTGESLWRAVRVDTAFAEFEPLENVEESFTWQQLGLHDWVVTVHGLSDTRYDMVRVIR